MTLVLVFGSVHEEQGLATTSALLAILESVHPTVIFLEIPPAAFPAYSDGTSSNLESSAARQYREANEVVLVPVDLPTPEDPFFRDWQYLDRRITATSPAYRQLIDENTINIGTYGFPYLNSERCQKVWSAVYDAMEAAIQVLSHDTRLFTIYETWRRTNELRDAAMLQGIDDYYRLNPFATGVLLVGAAHVQSIIKRSRVARDAGTPHIERGNLH
jgi:hypothetical protein